MRVGLVILGFVTLALLVWLAARRARPAGRQRWSRTDRLALTGILAGAVVGILPVAIGLLTGAESSPNTATISRPPFVAETVAVEGRSPTETELQAQGIRVAPGGYMTFQDLNNVRRTISSKDWNTITSTSRVPVTVRVVMDPGITTDATMERRTQYLADVIGTPQAGKVSAVVPMHILQDGRVISPILIVNGASTAQEVGDTEVTVSSRDGRQLMSGHFFGGQDNPVVPAGSAYFTYLQWSPQNVTARLTPAQLADVRTDVHTTHRPR